MIRVKKAGSLGISGRASSTTATTTVSPGFIGTRDLVSYPVFFSGQSTAEVKEQYSDPWFDGAGQHVPG